MDDTKLSLCSNREDGIYFILINNNIKSDGLSLLVRVKQAASGRTKISICVS